MPSAAGAALECEDPLRSLLNEEHDEHEHQDLSHDGTGEGFEELVDEPETERADDGTRELPDAAEHDDHERIDDVGLSELRSDVAELRDGDATETGDGRAEPERPGVDLSRRNAHRRGHGAVLGDRADLEPERRTLQDEPHQGHDQSGESDDDEPAIRQNDVGEELPAAREPGGVRDRDVLRAEQQADRLNQEQADAPGGEQRFERAVRTRTG